MLNVESNITRGRFAFNEEFSIGEDNQSTLYEGAKKVAGGICEFPLDAHESMENIYINLGREDESDEFAQKLSIASHDGNKVTPLSFHELKTYVNITERVTW